MNRILIAVAILMALQTRGLCQPTREAIFEFHKACKAQHIDTDLIQKFGVDYRGLNLEGIDLRSEGRNGKWINTVWRERT